MSFARFGRSTPNRARLSTEVGGIRGRTIPIRPPRDFTVAHQCERSVRELCVLCNKSPDRTGNERNRPANRDPLERLGENELVNELLLIEDDDQIRLALRLALEDEGYDVREAPDGASGLAAFHSSEPDLVLLDLRLPDMSGFEVCRALRAMSIVPIIMVTAQTASEDMVAGLEAGADDYVTKPIVPKELAARIRAHLRRVQLQSSLGPQSPGEMFGDVELRRDQGLVFKAGREIALTKTEFNLLCEFADHPNAVLSRDQLLERVWGYDYLGDSRLVDAHVHRLRVKIEDQPDDPKLILTVRGIGYRLSINS
ncbi:MAG: two-component response regulator MtrA [Actinomycetota bacterium]|jgi:DNA-binding response OmpR family regulator